MAHSRTVVLELATGLEDDEGLEAEARRDNPRLLSDVPGTHVEAAPKIAESWSSARLAAPFTSNDDRYVDEGDGRHRH